MRVEGSCFRTWVTGCAFCFFPFAANVHSAVLTFDEMPPAEYRVIENGYGGLKWNNFGVLNATNPTYAPYKAGMVTAPDVAFNMFGDPASVSGVSNQFALDSAYFTAVHYSPMQVRVRGYTNNTPIYDHTYAITGSAPTLVTFNHTEVDRVTFEPSPSTIFAMDNLSMAISATPFVTNVYTGVLTFDDIPGCWPGSVIPDGYGGLQWSNFYIYGGFGTVTSPYAASNGNAGGGNPASVSGLTPFYLGSAYVTPRSGWDMFLRVRGYAGNTALYDNSFYVFGGPRLINFNYANIDRATFESVDPSWVPFVIDNLRVGLTNTYCTYSFSPTNHHGPGPETGSLSVSTYAGCTWSVSNTNAWVTITSSLENTNSGDLTYTLSSNLSSSPRTGFITIAAQQFTITQSAAGGTNLVDLGVIQSGTVGHRYSRSPLPFGSPWLVVDAVVDQDQDSGGGAVLPFVFANFDTHNRFALTVSAPLGYKFLVRPPLGKPVRFDGGLTWWHGNSSPSRFGTLDVSFGSLQGAAPDFSASRTVLSDSHGFFGFNDIQSAEFTNELAFSTMTLTATVPNMNLGLGELNYNPYSSSEYLGLYYRTSDASDPGPFVFIVPAQPTVSLTVQPNGDVTITFTGTLQFAGEANGFTDVPGNPQGTYTIPKASLSARQFFRARN